VRSKLVRRKYALLALEWCINKYGESKYNDNKTLKLTVDSNLKDKDDDGIRKPITAWYHPSTNEIRLNFKKIHSLKELVGTVIHEYTHFLQDINVMYHKYTEEYGISYENHPYEKTANAREERDWKECRLWVLQQIRSK